MISISQLEINDLAKKLPGLLIGILLSITPSILQADQQTLAKQLNNLFKVYQLQPQQEKSNQLVDLEIMVIAAVLENNKQTLRANQYKQYLLEFFKSSSLRAIISDLSPDTPFLISFDPDPLFSRLVKDSYYYYHSHPTGQEQDEVFFKELANLTDNLINYDQQNIQAALTSFLNESPQSVFSGWAAYFLAWDTYQKQQGQTEAFYQLWREQPEHPVGKESYEARDLMYYNPERISLLSALIPGLGEETLEPGMREAGGQMYYELLYLAGTIGFAVAAQQRNRIENLTGALIFANLLLLNHRGSADRAFVMAHRRNFAQQKKFNTDHFSRGLIAPGRFQSPATMDYEFKLLPQRLKIGTFYQLQGMTDDLKNRGWILDKSVYNIGAFLAYEIDFYSMGNEVYQMHFGISPKAYLLLNRLLDNPLDPVSTDDGSNMETVGSINLIIGNRLCLGTSGWLQLNASIGEGYRWRHLSLAGGDYYQQDPITSTGLTLAWSGPSGHFWELGVSGDDSFQNKQVDLFNETVVLPSISWRLQFNLGVRF